MTDTIPDILARIVAVKRDLPAPDGNVLREWEEQAERAASERRDFRGALTARSPAIIAEIKKASPSKGLLAHQFIPELIAQQYEAGGAAALSILTDQPFFQGSLEDLRSARRACSLPVLRKDFTLDSHHVLEAAANGADAILLIAAILEEREIRELRELAARHGMAALVEVHEERELAKAAAAGADIIGVNNRDLNTFRVTLKTSLRLAPRIPSGALRISESGIHSAEDLRRLRDAGYHGFLIGEHLMKAADRCAALRALVAA